MPSIGRLLDALKFRAEAHTIKHSDARRQGAAAVRRMMHRQDWRTRRNLRAEATRDLSIEIPRSDGYLVPNATFDEVQEMVAYAQMRVSRAGLLDEPVEEGRIRVTTGLLEDSQLTAESPFVRFATNPAIVGAITEYLGAVPLLWHLDVWCSVARKNVVSSAVESELFHCDWDAVSQVKVFIHCSDVADENGPLVLVNAETSELVRNKLGYKYRNRVDDDTMTAITSGSVSHPIVGPAGTVALIDTSRCFHYGSRVTNGAAHRTMAMFQYVVPSAFVLPLDYAKRAPLRNLASPAQSRTQRLVMGATET